MPSTALQRGDVADTQSSNPHLDVEDHDASTIGITVPDGRSRLHRKAIPTQMASNRSRSNGRHGESKDSKFSDNGQLQTSLGSRSLARSIYDGAVPGFEHQHSRPHVQSSETALWDWNTPLDSIGETSSYYYEPQGELINRAADDSRTNPAVATAARTEFTIPSEVSDLADWSLSKASTSSNRDDGFAVPKNPSSVPAQVAGVKRKAASDRETTAQDKAPTQQRLAQMQSESSDDQGSPMDEQQPIGRSMRSQGHQPDTRGRSATSTSQRPVVSEFEATRTGTTPTAGGDGRRTLTDAPIPMVLPARKVFPIQIGDKLFRLSGASISSDAPSYFSQFFEEQLRQSDGADKVRTLYIDRDPVTFEDIALHLQGYHVEPRDGPHFVRLFADAQFYSLPRLTAQLFASTIYIRIGDSEFQIPRDLFASPGDSPNYFSLGFSIFFTTPNEVFPGLAQRTLLRPPSILPPSVPNRSAKTFADLLHILKGYPVEIRNDEHRQELLRDARYFHLKGLEQRLIPHHISYNLARKRTEILVRLEDIRQSGISFVADSTTPSSSAGGGGAGEGPSPASTPQSSATPNTPGWIFYQRPYVDSEASSLIVEITGEEATYLSIAPGSPSSPRRMGRATFFRQTLSRITSLLSVIANKMNLPTTQPLGLMMMERGAGVASLPVSPSNTGVSEERVKVRIGTDADVTVDGRRWFVGEEEDEEEDEEQEGMDVDDAGSASRKRRRARRDEDDEDEDEAEEWIVRKSQWRLRIQVIPPGVVQQPGRSGMEVILGAVRIEAVSSERGRNMERGFLT